MNTLQTIQTISKVGNIICRIVYICCIVGFCICAVGIIANAAGVPTFKLGGVEIKSFLENEKNLTEGALYSAMIYGAIICVGEGIIAKFASNYLKKELADGTPFTVDGAKELMRLGIISICVSVGMQAAVEITQKIILKMFADTMQPDFDAGFSVTVGAAMIVVSLICRYGAEQNAGKTSGEN